MKTQDLLNNFDFQEDDKTTDYYGSRLPCSTHLNNQNIGKLIIKDFEDDSYLVDLNISVCIGNLRQVNEKKVLEVLNGSY